MNQRREEILDTFIQLIERYGIDKTTMQDVAKEVGCSVGTLYNEFANKEELIEAFCQRLGDIMVARLDKISQDGVSLEQILGEILVGHVKNFNYLIRHNQGFRELLNEGESFRYIGKTTIDLRNSINRELIKRIAAIMDEGIRQGNFEIVDSEKTASLFVDAFSEYVAPPLVVHRENDEVISCAEQMFMLIMKGIKRGE